MDYSHYSVELHILGRHYKIQCTTLSSSSVHSFLILNVNTRLHSNCAMSLKFMHVSHTKEGTTGQPECPMYTKKLRANLIIRLQ